MNFDSGAFFSARRQKSRRYRAILADPPWRFETWSERGRDRSPDRHYRTLDLDAIKALPVAGIAAPDCVLFLWAVDSMLPEALELGRTWGFSFKTVAFYWAKTRPGAGDSFKRASETYLNFAGLFPMGTGYWTRANPEPCLLFTKGKPRRRNADVRKLIVSPRREHSRKPDEVRHRIERLVPGPYLELFARERRKGWDAWGDQVGRFDREAA